MKYRHYYIFLLFTLFLFAFNSLKAQQKKSTLEFKKIASSESTSSWMKLNQSLNKTSFLESAKTIFDLDEKTALKTTSSKSDKLGWVHHRVQQYYNNIPIEGATYILHEKDGYIKKANGDLVASFSNNDEAVLTEEEAIKFLLSQINAKKYAWEVAEYENVYKRQEKDESASLYPTAELVYYNSEFPKSKKSFTLCYKIDVYTIEPFERYWYYVNAQTGGIIDKISRIFSNCHTGTGSTNYHGSVNLTTSKVGNEYHLKHDCSANQGIHVYNANNIPGALPEINFTDTNNNWNNSNQKNGVEALWGSQKTYDYFKNEHGLNSFDNKGGEILSWVNCVFIDQYGRTSPNNAFWNGSVMLFGGGDGTSISSLTSLDIVAHEFTHAITQHSAALVYRNESGALNESFSDIFGTVIEFKEDNISNRDWKIAEDIFINSSSFLRNMANPNDKSHPDTYEGTFWYTGSQDKGGVHVNSGVQNFWFYLLAEGGSGINDKGKSYNVEAIGLNKAANIAFRNLTTYLLNYSEYADAKEGSIEAALDLYGTNEAQQVINAWCAVGVIETCYTIMDPPPSKSITISTPNGGENLTGSHNIQWSSTGSVDSVFIEYSLNRGSGWNRIAKTANNGNYTWYIPNLNTSLGKIRIKSIDDSSVSDESDNVFTILGCTVNAKFSFDTADLCAQNNITFTNESVDIYNPNLTNISYKWYINSNSSPNSTATNYVANFNTSGSRSVTLEASYPDGCKSRYKKTFYIKPATSADFSYHQINGTLNVELVADQANASSYNWSQNGSGIGSSKMIIRTFNSSGTYNICLNVNGVCGSSNMCKNVIVSNVGCAGSNVNANFTIPANNCVDFNSFFNNTSSGASSYTWKINGETVSSTLNLSYAFPDDGNYVITLIAQSANSCKDTKNRSLVVYPNADDLNPSNDYMSCSANNRSINAGVTNMQSYEWKLGANVVGTGQIKNATESGRYRIKATDRCGNSAVDYVLVALKDSDCVYPGDTNFDGIVNGKDLVYLGLHYGARGYPRLDQNTNFSPKASVNWGSSVQPTENESDNYDVDLKHVDADGNGYIDLSDFFAISINWGKTHSSGIPTVPLVVQPSNLNVNVVPNNNTSTSIGIIDDVVESYNINFESEKDDKLAVYAGHGALDLNGYFDNSSTGFKAISMTSANSWLVDEDNLDMVYLQFYNQSLNCIEYAYTCLDHKEKVGSGTVANALLEVINVSGLDGGDEKLTICGENFNHNGDLLGAFEQDFSIDFFPDCEDDIVITNDIPWQSVYKSNDKITTSLQDDIEIVNGDSIVYLAEERIRLNEGFSAKVGSRFTAKIQQPCD